jgi:hypothetical protein
MERDLGQITVDSTPFIQHHQFFPGGIHAPSSRGSRRLWYFQGHASLLRAYRRAQIRSATQRCVRAQWNFIVDLCLVFAVWLGSDLMSYWYAATIRAEISRMRFDATRPCWRDYGMVLLLGR